MARNPKNSDQLVAMLLSIADAARALAVSRSTFTGCLHNAKSAASPSAAAGLCPKPS
jgi:hypothetical protein